MIGVHAAVLRLAQTVTSHPPPHPRASQTPLKKQASPSVQGLGVKASWHGCRQNEPVGRLPVATCPSMPGRVDLIKGRVELQYRQRRTELPKKMDRRGRWVAG
ncbi:unnamed protein product [Protopolystoma xenopodis]|uniref:Uncharacterized protein n=1 Tax=Protopolystoma xenopodis TaxID=117903 RepID=A0A3S5CCP0_9PLAT|nr:unnamed protein product [Protopolystoma xenopodis]